MTLKAYRTKRDFNQTSEPYGSKKTDKGIFCVQFHEARRDHYDLRLEYGGVLLSWAVPKCPSFDPNLKRLAVKVEDHPIDYADFEGEIPLGQYGGGTVTLWDTGKYEPNCDFADGLEHGSLKFTLFGKRLKGRWALIKMDGDEKGKDNWLLIKEKDGFAGLKDITDTTSVTKHGNELIPLSDISTKQAHVSDKLPSGKDWVYEIKYDGYRIIAAYEHGKATLITRNGNDVSLKYRAVTDALTMLMGDTSAIFDGELVVLKDGRTDFGALQHYSYKDELSYIAFDLLAYDGTDLRDKPLIERKKTLKKALANAPKCICYGEHYEEGDELFSAAKNMGLEGIVCKKINATYYENDWLKIKCRPRQEFVIVGYTHEKKDVSSLLLGLYNGDELTYVGRVGTGISQKTATMLKKEFAPLVTEIPTVKTKTKNVVWLRPVLMAEVEYAEWTDGGRIRQASFKGLRRDKNAATVKNESPDAIFGITVTSPGKIIYSEPEVTKLDIARYYESVAELMLSYLTGRPISVMRCNGGIESCFYKKHPQSDKTKLIYINSVSELMQEVQLGTVEFHTPCYNDENSFMVFDLDPDEGVPMSALIKGATDLKKILDSLNLTSFVKVSGGKGYHIVVPMHNTMTAEEFSAFAKSTAQLMATKFPDLYTANIKKEKRHGKIFIDWQRNTLSATAVCPYSLRARKGATVSLPITWSALSTTPPAAFDIFTAQKSLDRNPWKDFWSAN